MSEREDLIRKLYAAALKRPIGERPSFVATQSHGDDDVRRRVEALLKGQQETELPGHDLAGGSMLASGTLIGTYRIDGPLGAGGMGIVYRATDTKLNRPAAIKVLPENLADPEARRRFQREAQMVSSLNHPHIVTVYDAGEYQDRQYLITEYVDGGTLRQWASQPRGWQQIVELLIGVADGIAVAHEAGILHRDIKPENILLAKNGYAKLADFGLAKLLEADPLADDAFEGIKAGDNSTLVGTAAYMSPEQAQGRALDGRSDVYSFGLVLHELLSGTRPLPIGDARAQATAQLGETVPAPLRAIIAKALEAEPADRYQTMRELVVDLRRLVRRSGLEEGALSGPLVANPTQTSPTAARAPGIRAQPTLYAIALAVLAAVLIAAYYFRADVRSTAQGNAVAVLPFVNETGSDDDVPISEGLGDTLRQRLMGLQGISVQARASSASFRGQNADPRTIARSLGVGMLIDGTVRKHGDNLEVLVEVLDDKGFAVRPTLSFERPRGELQALQQQIVSEVAAVLAPMAGASPAIPAPAPTSQSERAYLLVVFGNHSYNEVREDDLTIDEKKLDKAIDYYRNATMADPKYIAAQTWLASALLWKGDVDAALEPLSIALGLAESTDPSSAAADLSDVYYTSAQYLQRAAASAQEVEGAFKKALALNPNNADALGAYALWLMPRGPVPGTPRDADALFRAAKRLDQQSILRYSDYAEYLGTADDIDGLHQLAAEIVARFPNPRGYLALARLYEHTGELDIAIAWGLRALKMQPEDELTHWQLGELFARIGDDNAAAKLDPMPAMNRLWLERRYQELVNVGEEYVIAHPEELKARYLLAFGYNAIEDFKSAKRLLESMGLPPPPGRDVLVLEGNIDSQYPQFLASYIDALQALDTDGSHASQIAELSRYVSYVSQRADVFAKSWWTAAIAACAKSQLGRSTEALDTLDRVVAAHGLVWSPLLQDSPCFKRLAAEPRYKAAVERVEERKRQLRRVLPATLREHGVADMISSPPP